MITVCSPAKINLILKITGKRQDGYHNIETIMQEIDLKDTLQFKLTSDKDISINNTGLIIPGHKNENLIYKAAIKFLSLAKINNQGLQIDIHKRIPFGSGMGGGSSNAIATLIGLNKLFNQPLNFEQLKTIASELGSDTVFFLHGGRCFCSGRGEIVNPMDHQEQTEVKLFIPEFSVSTASVFKNLKLDEAKPGFSFNDLEEPAFIVAPELQNIKNQLNSLTDKAWRLTGSGSTFFYLQPIEEEKINLSKLKGKLKGRTIETNFSYNGCYVS